jgi:hypothetical protein
VITYDSINNKIYIIDKKNDNTKELYVVHEQCIKNIFNKSIDKLFVKNNFIMTHEYNSANHYKLNTILDYYIGNKKYIIDNNNNHNNYNIYYINKFNNIILTEYYHFIPRHIFSTNTKHYVSGLYYGKNIMLGLSDGFNCIANDNSISFLEKEIILNDYNKIFIYDNIYFFVSKKKIILYDIDNNNKLEISNDKHKTKTNIIDLHFLFIKNNCKELFDDKLNYEFIDIDIINTDVKYIYDIYVVINDISNKSTETKHFKININKNDNTLTYDIIYCNDVYHNELNKLLLGQLNKWIKYNDECYLYFYDNFLKIYENSNIHNYYFNNKPKFTCINKKYLIIYYVNNNTSLISYILKIYKISDLIVNNNIILDENNILDSLTLTGDNSFISEDIVNIYLNDKIYLVDNNNKYYKLFIDEYFVCNEMYTYTIDKNNNIISINETNGKDYIYTDSGIYIYDSDSLQLNKLNIESVAYSYKNEHISLNHINKTFKIIDNNFRIIYGDYINSGDKFIFKNIHSINIIEQSNIFFDELNNTDNNIIIITENILTNLYYSDKKYKINKLQLINNNLNSSQFFYFYNNTLYYLAKNNDLYKVTNLVNENDQLNINEEIICSVQLNINDIINNMKVNENIYFQITSITHGRDRVVVVNNTDGTYSNFIGIDNNTGNIDIMPYKIENCYLDQINNICLLTNDIIIHDNNDLYYIYDDNIIKLAEYNGIVQDICNVNNILYIYIKDTTTIKQINLNTYQNNVIIYNIDGINYQNYYKMFPLIYSSDYYLNDILIIVTHDNDMYYINFYIKQENLLIKLNILDDLDNNIELTYDKIKNISCDQLITNGEIKKIIYICNNNKVDIKFIEYDSTTIYVTNNNTYIDKNKIFSINDNKYIDNININCPSLFCTDYNTGIYNKILLSNLQSNVTINNASNRVLLDINGGKIYNINYDELSNETNVRKYIDCETLIVTDDNNIMNVLVNYNKTNDEIISQNVDTFVYNIENNSYFITDFNSTDSEFYNFQQRINVYSDDKNVYMDNYALNKYTINGDNIDRISFVKIDEDNNNIKIQYTIDTLKNNKLMSTVCSIVTDTLLNGSIELTELSQNTDNFSYTFNTISLFINDIQNQELTQSFTIDKYTYTGYYLVPKFDKINVITKNNYILIDNLEFLETLNNNSIIKIRYIINTDISNKNIDYDSYLYIKYNNYYIGKILNENGKNILEIYIRNFSNMVWQCNNQDYYMGVLKMLSYNTLTVYKINYDNDNDQFNIYNDMNIFNGNLIKLDYLRYLNNVLNNRDENSFISYKRIFQETDYIINDIINNTFMNLSLIETSNEDIIINNSVIPIYKNINDSINLTQYNRIYFKVSNNFSNIIGITGINNYISDEFINKCLLNFHNALMDMFSDKNDVVINNLKIINYHISSDEYLLWDVISTKKINDTIKYIYIYLKQMLIFANDGNKFIDFIENEKDCFTYLYENTINFKQVYDKLIKTNYLVSWDKIKNVINQLYLSMININKLLHDKLVLINGNSYYLINSNFHIEVNKYNKIIYLENTRDINTINYVYNYIETIFNNYELLDVLNYEQQIVDMFYKSFDNIFNDESLGLTTLKYINNASDLFSYNFNDIYNNRNTLNVINKTPLSCIFSNSFLPQNLVDLSTNFQKIHEINLNNLKIYNDNSNILSIGKIDIETLQNKYNDYINSKSKVLITNVNNELNNIVIIKLNRLENIIKYNFIGFTNPKTQKYNIFMVLSVDKINNNVQIKVDNINDYDNTLIGTTIFVNIDCLKLKNFQKNIYSSNEIARAYCCELFNDFNAFDNVDYQNNKNWNFYDETTEKIKYFEYLSSESLTTEQNNLNYNKSILNKLNKKYAISDLSIIKDVFNNVFTLNNTLSTIENFTYNLIQFINPYKITGNNLFNHIYLVYKLNNISDNNTIFDDFINVNNLEYIINDFNSKIFQYYGHFNKKNNIKKNMILNNILRIINKTSDSSKFKYSIMKNVLISRFINFDTSNVDNNTVKLVTNNRYISNVYPYCNCTDKLNIESNLINYQINDTHKFNDIELNLEKIKNYYLKNGNIDNTYENVINTILFFDKIKSKIAYEKIKHILSFNLTKFDLFEFITDSDTNRKVYYRDCIIDEYERIGYYKLKFQQLLVWKFLTKISSSINNSNKFYKRQQKSQLYLHNTKHIDILTDDHLILINNALNLFSTHINLLGSYNKDDNDVWNIIINNTDKNFDEISNLVLPCDYCYIAYIIVKSLPINAITKNTQFIFPTQENKIDYNDNNLILLNYTDEIVKFLLTQKNKSYDINDWMGTFQVDQYKIQKVHLCNIISLNTIFRLLLSEIGLYNIESGFGSIKMINYILSIILNWNGNSVESVYNDKLIYPTLYLTNGILVRTTELPEYYYYDDKNNNYLEINRVKLVKNGVNYYGIIQNDISNFIKKSYDKRIDGYNNYFNESWASDIYNFDMENICINYTLKNFEIDIEIYKIKIDIDIIDNINIVTYGELKNIDKNDYVKYIYDKCYCVTNNNDYLFIDQVELNEQYLYLTINTNLSKINNDFNTYDCIKGGLYNIIDNIYSNNDLRYIFTRHLYENYDDYFQIFDQSANIIENNLNKIYSNYEVMDYSLYQYLVDLLDYLNKYNSSNLNLDYVTIDNLTLSNQITTNTLMDTIKIVNNYINYIKSDIYEKQMFSNEIMINITNYIDYPEYTIYNPKPLVGKWTKYLGHNIIDYIEMRVGDQIIQKITGDYLHINYSLLSENGKTKKYLENIGYTSELLTDNNILPNKNLYICLPWFFDNPGIYLPLISLLHTNVSFKVKYKKLDDLIIINGGTNNYQLKSYINGKKNNDITLKSEYMAEYIYLGDDERLKFAQSRHEYIIEQIQYMSPVYINNSKILHDDSEIININFNNCSKDLFWYCKTNNNILNKDYCNYTMTTSTYNNTINKKSNLNLFKEYLPEYKSIIKKKNKNINFIDLDINENDYNIDWFYKTEQSAVVKMLENIPEYNDDGPIIRSSIILNGKTLMDHDNIYTTSVIPGTYYKSNNTNGLHVHTFALHPTENQPSGDFNFSTVDDFKLKLTFDESVAIDNKYIMINAMTRTYNIFRVFSGYGACVY